MRVLDAIKRFAWLGQFAELAGGHAEETCRLCLDALSSPDGRRPCIGTLDWRRIDNGVHIVLVNGFLACGLIACSAFCRLMCIYLSSVSCSEIRRSV
jgi:hypothetical protein